MPLTKFREKMSAAGYDAFIVTQPENRRYLSGFTGSDGALFITAAEKYLLTDSRYYEQVGRESPEWTLIKASYRTDEHLVKLLESLHLTGATIGFEADYFTVAQFKAWQKTLPNTVTLKATSGFVGELRAIKTPAELAAIKRAQAVADDAMAHIYDWIQPGVTERDVAWELEVTMRTHGATALSFDTIVAAGANSALPHATPGDTVIEPGDVVLIDMGCVVDGYCSDMTRTFSLGEPKNSQYVAVWNIVEQARATAAAGISAGLSSRQADALARDVILAAGYGDQFGHSLGHGVGLAVHELPPVSYARESELQTNMVITIEPGIYLPGAFGVRLEDMAVVADGGVEIITCTPKIATLPRS